MMLHLHKKKYVAGLHKESCLLISIANTDAVAFNNGVCVSGFRLFLKLRHFPAVTQ